MKSLLLIVGLGLGILARAQSKDTKSLVESQNFVFKAQTAIPQSGRSRNLTSDYDLKVSKDVVVSYLPYYGQAYEAPIDPSKGGLDFSTKDFSYASVPGKKDGWTVTIKPRDYKDVQQLVLRISSEGYASLQVISTNRQAISFNGVITGGSQ
ncbi:MAG TPA: DUF4251 domain-containing protein [Puia sp.]|jgi:hypothetical protein|nr:DUF4251 domain-containing protein [Puia sp.]